MGDAVVSAHGTSPRTTPRPRSPCHCGGWDSWENGGRDTIVEVSLGHPGAAPGARVMAV